MQMPAHNTEFPWPSYYGNYTFFEERMAFHSRLLYIKPIGSGLYELTRSNGAIIRVFICECYSFGVAEYHEVVTKIGKIDAIIINSNWCGYSNDCKEHCRARKIGLFNIRDFMAALNIEKFWEYTDQ